MEQLQDRVAQVFRPAQPILKELADNMAKLTK
jgi:hypothetical protein